MAMLHRHLLEMAARYCLDQTSRDTTIRAGRSGKAALEMKDCHHKQKAGRRALGLTMLKTPREHRLMKLCVPSPINGVKMHQSRLHARRTMSATSREFSVALQLKATVRSEGHHTPKISGGKMSSRTQSTSSKLQNHVLNPSFTTISMNNGGRINSGVNNFPEMPHTTGALAHLGL